MRRTVSLALALAVTLASCSKAGTTGDNGRTNSWTKPHVFTYTDAQDINTLNPHLGTSVSIFYIAQMTMAWLIRFDEKNEPYPELATEVPTQRNGGVSKDGLTITYHLRRGVRWSDGAPFSADDVAFSTRVVMNAANNETSRGGWDQIDLNRIEEPDKYTIVYHLRKPYSPFVETFFATGGANPCVLPQHLLAKYPNINNVPYNAKPVGIGPFVVDRWDRSQQVVLVANPQYWRGRPKLDRVVYKVIPDRNTALAQVQSKSVDMWMTVPGSYLSRVRDVDGYRIFRRPSFVWDHLDFNVQHPVASDPVVRRALRIGIDRKALLQKVARGVGVLQEVPTPKTAPYYVDMALIPYDPARANAMLDRDGWVRGSDGIRAKNGVRLSFNFATTAGMADSDAQIELIRANWKAMGAEINLHHYASALMFAAAQNGGIVFGNSWDAVTIGWSADAIGDSYSIYGCKSFPPEGENTPRWCNPTAEAALLALYGHYDQQQRNADTSAWVHRFVDDAPSIVLKGREDIFVHNNDLKNFHPNNVSPFDNMMDVDI